MFLEDFDDDDIMKSFALKIYNVFETISQWKFPVNP